MCTVKKIGVNALCLNAQDSLDIKCMSTNVAPISLEVSKCPLAIFYCKMERSWISNGEYQQYQ